MSSKERKLRQTGLPIRKLHYRTQNQRLSNFLRSKMVNSPIKREIKQHGRVETYLKVHLNLLMPLLFFSAICLQRNSPPMTAPQTGLNSHPLSPCEVWIGTSEANASDASWWNDLDKDEIYARDGIGIVYMPPIPDEKKVPNLDPSEISPGEEKSPPRESKFPLCVGCK
ncbi:hypothetical protein BU17DRAFT_95758 [Hysterangium stoloniferum]|nr:hypothetical protein BU17DRAFT_95758 [Hysterangium stoloniferum]